MINARTPAINPPLKISVLLPNGGMVLDYKWREHTKGEAEGQHGIVLCLLLDNPFHPFVVWRFIKTYYGRVNCIHGDYFETLEAAFKIFHARKL